MYLSSRKSRGGNKNRRKRKRKKTENNTSLSLTHTPTTMKWYTSGQVSICTLCPFIHTIRFQSSSHFAVRRTPVFLLHVLWQCGIHSRWNPISAPTWPHHRVTNIKLQTKVYGCILIRHNYCTQWMLLLRIFLFWKKKKGGGWGGGSFA